MGQHGQYLKLGAAAAAVGIALALVGVIVVVGPPFQAVPEHEGPRPTPLPQSDPPKPTATATATPTATAAIATPTATAAIAKIAAPALRADLERLYAASGDKLIWSGDSAAQPRLRDLSSALDAASAQGIDGTKATAARDALQASDVDTAQGDVALRGRS